MGAWIETRSSAISASYLVSHPTWVRGLKPRCSHPPSRLPSSHPTWVRGLKHSEARLHLPRMRSHPTWVRGLKQCPCGHYKLPPVAPYVGAWIETLKTHTIWKQHQVAPYVGAWIETYVKACEDFSAWSHPTWVRGLKPVIIQSLVLLLKSHPTWVRGLKPDGLTFEELRKRSHPTWVRGLKHVG